jgi:hypothetical protein
MQRIHGIDLEFAREYVLPVQDVLGKQSLKVTDSLQTAHAAILKRPKRAGRRRLADYEPLTAWRTLTDSQTSELRDILLDPLSYWNGWPKYRRFPPRPGFAVKLRGANGEADLLIDLHNPGWELLCSNEAYWGFNFAGPRLAAIAKAVFPEYASQHLTSVWKRDAIKSLEDRVG